MDNYTLELDNGKIVGGTVNGKKIKASFMNALKEAQETSFWELYDGNRIGRNLFSGVEVELNGFEASIFAWTMKWYRNYEAGVKTVSIRTYDNMRYLFLELNPNAYFDLID